MANDISENVRLVRERMERAQSRAGVSGKVQLVAATKMNSAERVALAIAAGVDACGENRVQEMTEKLSQGAYVGAPLHFIGHLQKNKVNKVVGNVDLIESVDSPELLRLISARAKALGLRQEVLLELSLAGEAAKTGAPVDTLPQLLEAAEALDGIFVRGLMTVPPISTKEGENRPYFAALYKLFVDIGRKKYNNVSMDFLSMGMSGDFEDAILEGANAVRVGSAIFGNRDYGQASSALPPLPEV
jgi:hypothetical protein